MTDSNGTTFIQPKECSTVRDTMPTLPNNLNYYNQVPLYQERNPSTDMQEVLQSCCSHRVWIFEDPDPCTAVCPSFSEAETRRVMYCLNAHSVVHGSRAVKSGAGRVGVRGVSWGSLLVGLLLLGALV
ncbi:uncharacterized protein N7511_004571 [Penicillium nucicola]|uniref:uncharacterized protein n=1 Tax=Penicillium nucicola TaxID=1850975 RepID=UPI002545BCB4|nr:uncharacterized protein N7511_004571 [Penicillium nucicola]KAJ5766955.1 hypothetical protein N7511_004571 [Penicillium nucicola]